jgi:hypothetical protein
MSKQVNYEPIRAAAIKVFTDSGMSPEVAKSKAFEVVDSAALIAQQDWFWQQGKKLPIIPASF